MFMGVDLANAYNWTGCPDDTPNGPVAFLRTPQVPLSNCIVLPCAPVNFLQHVVLSAFP